MFHQRCFVFHSPWSERRVGKHTFFTLKEHKDGKKGYFSATEMEGENKHFYESHAAFNDILCEYACCCFRQIFLTLPFNSVPSKVSQLNSKKVTFVNNIFFFFCWIRMFSCLNERKGGGGIDLCVTLKKSFCFKGVEISYCFGQCGKDRGINCGCHGLGVWL